MGNSRRLAGLAVVASALMMAAGCGAASGSGSPGSASATPSAAALTQKMRAAVEAATSVHVSGQTDQGGKQMSMDFSMTRAGALSGTVALGSAPITILVTGGKAYVKSTAASLKAMHMPASSCAVLCSKYLETSGAGAKGLTGGMTWSGFFTSGLLADKSVHGLKVIRLVTVDGQAAWLLRSSDGSTGYVAAHGPAYLLRIDPPRNQGGGQADFTQWNSATIPPPPPASKIVTPSQLGA